MMKLLMGAILAVFAVTGAYAAAGATTSQQRMKECAPHTKGMTKEQRSEFMSKCLSKEGHDAAMSGKAAAGKAKTGKRARKAHAKAESAAAAAGASADQAAAKAKNEAQKKTRKAKKAAEAATAATEAK